MAGFTNAASVIAPIAQGAGVAANVGRIATNVLGGSSGTQDLRAQQDLAMRQLQQLQDQDYQRTMEEAAADRAKIAADAESAEGTRRAALKRAVARQRALYGSSGIETNTSGSAQAVLLGLFDESEEEKNQREKLDTLRYGAVDQELSAKQRLNILQRTQLGEKQRLQQSISGGSRSIFGRLFGAL
jgi:hypothetical protein